ncbi:MAG: hypothetical protein AAF985_27205 [Bacteroidota bacterium]
MIINQIKQSEERLETEYEKLRLLNADDTVLRDKVMNQRITVLHQLFQFRNEVIDTFKK